MTEMDWSLSRYDVEVSIAGEPAPASAVQWHYELNAIPSASIAIPTGSDAETGARSPAAALMERLSGDDAVEIRVRRRTSGDAKDFGLPDGEWVKVFEGRYVGPGFRRDRSGRSQFEVSAAHWLSKADASSIFSRWSHPSNPAQYSASLMGGPEGTGAATSLAYVGVHDPADALTVDNIAKDFWEDALRPYFRGLAAQDMFRIPEQGAYAAGDGDATSIPNGPALEVLGRIRSSPSLRFAAAADSDLRAQVLEHLLTGLADVGAMASHTLWDVLVAGLAANYMFAIVPRFEDALVVPYVPTRRDWHATIGLDEYNAVDFSALAQRPIRAVGILSRYDSSTGMSGSPDADGRTADAMVGGWYKVPGAATGMVHVEPAPAWASRCVAMPDYAGGASGASGGLVATADRPDAAGPPDLKARAAVAAGAAAAQGFLARYARSRASQLVAADRRGGLGGPLRADLCPGTSVLVPVADDLAAGGTSLSFVGSIVRVSSFLDCRTGAARTSLELAHLRTFRENGEGGVGLDSHPLYSEPFTGAAMRG